MIDQETLDYIKQQTADGVPREQIVKYLLADGWEMSDIDEALLGIGNIKNVLIDDSTYPDVKSAKFALHTKGGGASRAKLFFTIFAILLIITLVIALIVFAFSRGSSEETVKEEVVTEKPSEEVIPEPEPAPEEKPAEELPFEDTPADAPIETNVWLPYSYVDEKFSVDFLTVPHVVGYPLDTPVGQAYMRVFESNLNYIEPGLKHSVHHMVPPSGIFGAKDTKAVREQKAIDFYKKYLASNFHDIVYASGTSLSGHKVVLFTVKGRGRLYKGRITSQNDKIYAYFGECLFCTEIPRLKEFITSFKLLP